MENTLFVTDLDGTLLGSDARISQRSRDLLNELIAKGLRFSYATARSYMTALFTVPGLALREPVLAYNGALMVSPDGEKVYHAATLQYAAIVDAVEALMTAGYYPMVHTLTQGNNRVAWMAGKENEGLRNYLADRPADPRMHAVDSAADLFAGDIFNLSLVGEKGWITRAHQLLVGHPLLTLCLQRDTYHTADYWLEIQHKDATKAKGIHKLQEMLGLSKVVCFGDNHNDLPMFQTADASYAVANAVPELKEAATGVIDSNTEDGVARFLQQRFLAGENP